MTTYESEIKTISANNEVVFAKITDLRNLESFKDKIPAEANISEFICNADSIDFAITSVGSFSLRIVEKEEFKTIKLGAENSPIEFYLCIMLAPINQTETSLHVILEADLPMMIKMMFGNKLQEFVNLMAKGFSKIEY